jgi:phosphate transport system substrate-binding protein
MLLVGLVALVFHMGLGAISAQSVTLVGAGATFPGPLYAKWAQVYAAERGVRINYQPVGSGEGMRLFAGQAADFGATDALPTREQLAHATGQVLFLPMVGGAVVPVYAVPNLGHGLAFTGAVLADIFLGKINRWDDKRLVDLNPQAKLPDAPIVVVHRSDDSGTTAIWTNYLSKVSGEWKEHVGEGSTVPWPVGREARGSQGMVDLLRRTENSLGYVELAYAFGNRMTFGSVRNKAGQLVAASLSSTTKALEAALPIIPDDYLTYITNPDAGFAYPIAGFTYLLVYADQADSEKGRALAQFLWWATHEGQKYGFPFLYAPLPPLLVSKVERTLKSLTVNGQPALP